MQELLFPPRAFVAKAVLSRSQRRLVLARSGRLALVGRVLIVGRLGLVGLVGLFGCEVCSILLEKLLGAFFRQIACGKAELHRLLVERERFVERDAGRAYRLDDFIEAVANLIV